jgi:organic radical activating enzyme
MKNLRVLLFKDCNRNCALCCNKNFELDELPQVDTYAGYDSIILTGGEPMLKPTFIVDTMAKVRKESNAPIYMNTAKCDDYHEFLWVLAMLDGVTLTLHEQEDVADFVKLQAFLRTNPLRNRSLRLNVFSHVDISRVNTENWEVKTMEWIEDCPLPENEVFMRV